jgi:hypothetical protein
VFTARTKLAPLMVLVMSRTFHSDAPFETTVYFCEASALLDLRSVMLLEKNSIESSWTSSDPCGVANCTNVAGTNASTCSWGGIACQNWRVIAM